MAASPFASSSAAQGFHSFAAHQNAAAKSATALRSAPTHAKARAAAEEFEAVFLNSMFNQMMAGIDGEGPFGGGPAVGVWRTFLTDEYAKSYARKGGIGIADQVYRTLLAQQEAKSR
ncbi:MAG: flagellar rod assembly protein FlgJ [Pseudorhodoplanes sp.]|nr:MAG: flagellar rod assembly protein FlgJ [Pseudorhodoplanes sp.]